MKKKINILFIQGLFYDPTQPNFKDRFEMLSEKCCGHVISISDPRYDGLRFGEFTYHALPYIKNKFVRYVSYTLRIMSLGTRLNRMKKFDYVHSYDPIFFGLSGVLIKLLTGVRLIVEVNGHYSDDVLRSGGGIA